MENVHRRAITKSWVTLVHSLTSEHTMRIMDFLVENDILTVGMREAIECERTTSAINRKMLDIVKRRGPHAFGIFVEALLQNDLNHIADVLLFNVNVPSQNTRGIVSHPGVTQQNNTSRRENSEVAPRFKQESPNESNDECTECNICMSDRIAVALAPCGHTLCSSCGDRFLRERSCCFCKQRVVSLIRIYI